MEGTRIMIWLNYHQKEEPHLKSTLFEEVLHFTGASSCGAKDKLICFTS